MDPKYSREDQEVYKPRGPSFLNIDKVIES